LKRFFGGKVPPFFLPTAVALIAVPLTRCLYWSRVLTEHGVELVPTDSHFYVRFAIRQLASFPRFTAFDPFVGFPEGSLIHWPPLHTWLVAAAISLHRGNPELAAAWVGPAIALLEAGILGLIAARLYDRRSAFLMVAFWALLPAAIESSRLGNCDHHVHEGFLVAAISLVLGRALGKPSIALALGAGILMGMGRFLTTSGFLFLIGPAAALPLAVVLDRSSETARWIPRLGIWLGITSAAISAIGAGAFGQFSNLGYEQLSSFQPLFALAVFSGAVALSGTLAGKRRWLLGLLLPAAILFVLREQLSRGWHHLGKSDPLVALVEECKPLSLRYALETFGVPLFAFPVALVGALKGFRRRDLTLLPAVLTAGPIGFAAVQQIRFIMPWMGSLAVVVVLGLPKVFEGLSGRRAVFGRVLVAIGGLGLIFGVGLLRPLGPFLEVIYLRPTLNWMRAHTPPASPDPFGSARPDYGVLANFINGNFITLWAERPVVSSNFSQIPWYVAANMRGANALAAPDDEELFRRSTELRARYLVMTPYSTIMGLPDVDVSKTSARRLFLTGGMRMEDGTGTAHFRLVQESPEIGSSRARGHFARLFEIVPGALIQGRASPGQPVLAQLSLRNPEGHSLDYRRKVVAGADGRFELRVAYPTNSDAPVKPALETTGYRVIAGAREAGVSVDESSVRTGAAVEVTGLEPDGAPTLLTHRPQAPLRAPARE
jgi:dolichyl-diphosphooligosaccharide--protein glycosyltransferase